MAVRSPEPTIPRAVRYQHFLLVSLLAAAALAPLLHLVALMIANYVDVPYYDAWSVYYRIAGLMSGSLSPGTYFAQYNEARPAVPLFLLFLVHHATHDLRIDVILNLSLAVATAGATLLLLRKTNPGITYLPLLAVSVLFNLNFFSLAQWQNWNWHILLLMFLPNFFFVLGWVINFSSLPPLLRSTLVSLCCALSTFCFANGLLQWFLIVPLASGRKEKTRLWSLHFGAALLCFAFYFTGYKSRGEHSLWGGLFHDSSRLVAYFFAWLGSSLSGGSLPIAETWGVLLLLTFVFLVICCWSGWRVDRLQIGWLPWISMGCYAIISSALAAGGRSHIGLEQALRSRYCTISQWLIVGIIGLSVTLLRQNWERKPAQARVGACLLALFAASFIMFQTRHEVQAADAWSKFAERMRFQKQSFGLESEQPGQLWTFDHPNRRFVLNAYKMMQEAGFLRDSFHSNKILDLLAAHKTGQWNEGELHFGTYLPFRDIRCRGWSIGGNPDAGNRVLIALVRPDSGKVLAIADGPINRLRRDVVKLNRASSPALAGFDLQFQVPKLDPGHYRLTAFRYGKDEKAYYPIGRPAALEIPL